MLTRTKAVRTVVARSLHIRRDLMVADGHWSWSLHTTESGAVSFSRDFVKAVPRGTENNCCDSLRI